MKFVKNNPILIVFVIIITLVLWQFVIADNVLPEDKFYDETVTEYTGEWERVLADGSTVKQEVPGKCNAKRGEEIVVRTTLPSDIYEDTYLCFRSGKQDMEFYVDSSYYVNDDSNIDYKRLIESLSAIRNDTFMHHQREIYAKLEETMFDFIAVSFL